MATNPSRFEVFLDRPRGIATGLTGAAVTTAMTLLLSPMCAIGFLVAAIILARYVDPRPQLVLDENGATFGGFNKSTVGHDVHVPWDEIEGVGPVETPDLDVKVTKSMSLAPRWMTGWQARVLGLDTLAVKAAGGRTFKVWQPGRGLRLEDVRLELLRRIESAP